MCMYIPIYIYIERERCICVIYLKQGLVAASVAALQGDGSHEVVDSSAECDVSYGI